MPASAEQLAVIRLKIGDSGVVVFTDPELNALWDDAALGHEDERVILQQTVVDALEALLADSAKRVTYRQNESQENLSDVFKHLEKLHSKHQARLTSLLESTQSVARLGHMKPTPSRLKEYPDA